MTNIFIPWAMLPDVDSSPMSIPLHRERQGEGGQTGRIALWCTACRTYE